MKILGQIFLFIFIIPVVLLGMVASTVKFDLLRPQFWENTYEEHGVYSSLTGVLKKSVIDQTVKEGGRVSDINSLTDLLTNSNIKIFFNKNLENTLNFLDGTRNRFFIYIRELK